MEENALCGRASTCGLAKKPSGSGSEYNIRKYIRRIRALRAETGLGSADRESLRGLRVAAAHRPVDPLVCPKCGWDMKVVAVIEDPAEIRRILRHLTKIGRSPPDVHLSSVS